MSHSKTIEVLYSLVPLKPWRGFLIRRHIEKCPRCQEGLASREAVGSLLVKEAEVDIGRSLWAGVEALLPEASANEGINARVVRPPVMRRWGWAAPAAVLFVLISSFILLKDFPPEGASSTAAVPVRFELEYVRVGGQPARTVVFQPQGSDMIIVWAGKNI